MIAVAVISGSYHGIGQDSRYHFKNTLDVAEYYKVTEFVTLTGHYSSIMKGLPRGSPLFNYTS
ncbi:hypothetical protein [Paenibacillus glacialis]|uniref:hypothetical protein n=1 Tax=Paenibacillus glacialis TaxID=494026 RepID=UPI0011AB8BB2|nr:hypothetical protein [Paenibacillus glacialis]